METPVVAKHLPPYTFFPIVVVLEQPSDIHLLYEQPVEGAAHPLPTLCLLL